MAQRTIRKGHHQAKFAANHAAAKAGDLEAMRYVMERDPSMASAQLLMHIQDGSNPDEQEFSKDAAINLLGLREKAGKDLPSSRLSDFTGVYDQAMGTKNVSEMGVAEKATWSVLEGPHAGYRSAKNKAAKKMGFGKDRHEDPLAGERLARMTAAMNVERAAKPGDNRDALWEENGLSVLEREYMRTRNFIATKTLDEMEDESNQRMWKSKATGEGDATPIPEGLDPQAYVAALSSRSAKKGTRPRSTGCSGSTPGR